MVKLIFFQDMQHPRSKNYQLVRADSDFRAPSSASSPSFFTGIGKKFSNAKQFFSKNNLVQRLLPAQLSLDCDRDFVGECGFT